MAKAVFGIASSPLQAESIVTELKLAGFSENDVSVLFPDRTSSRDFAHERHTKAPEGAVAGVGAGGALGGALGWLAGIGTLAIPGLGPFVAAGPLMAALSGLALGAAVGGIAGALVGMGVPEYEARRYAAKIQEGNILISAHCDTNEKKDRALDIFKKAQAHDISTTTESEVKQPPRQERWEQF